MKSVYPQGGTLSSKKTQTLAIYKYILDEIIHGTRSTGIVDACVKQWRLSARTCERHLSAVRHDLAATVGKTMDEVHATLHERYERMFKDSWELTDLATRLNIQSKITARHADLFGFGKSKGDTTVNVDLLRLIPEPIQRAMVPTVYDEKGNVLRTGDLGSDSTGADNGLTRREIEIKIQH